MKLKIKLHRILCKLGLHNWTCEYVRYWKTYFKCRWCGKVKSIKYGFKDLIDDYVKRRCK